MGSRCSIFAPKTPSMVTNTSELRIIGFWFSRCSIDIKSNPSIAISVRVSALCINNLLTVLWVMNGLFASINSIFTFDKVLLLLRLFPKLYKKTTTPSKRTSFRMFTLRFITQCFYNLIYLIPNISGSNQEFNSTSRRRHNLGYLFLFHRSEEHTSELQSRPHLVCRLLLEKKKRY